MTRELDSSTRPKRPRKARARKTRDERREREVRHHRGQVRTADGEERPERCAEREPRHLRSITPPLDSVAGDGRPAALAELSEPPPRWRTPLFCAGTRSRARSVGPTPSSGSLARPTVFSLPPPPFGPAAPRSSAWRSCCPQAGVFVVRDGDRVAAATTVPEPTAGLVLYDLRTCLRRIEEPAPKRRRKKTDA